MIRKQIYFLYIYFKKTSQLQKWKIEKNFLIVHRHETKSPNCSVVELIHNRMWDSYFFLKHFVSPALQYYIINCLWNIRDVQVKSNEMNIYVGTFSNMIFIMTYCSQPTHAMIFLLVPMLLSEVHMIIWKILAHHRSQ